MENQNSSSKVIDLSKIIKIIWEHRKTFYKTLPIAFVLSCVYILGIPRYYSTNSKLAPELGNSMNTGTLGSLASSFGIDLSSMESSDAITPLLYPDLMEDNGFVARMFNIQVENVDGDVKTTYYKYLQKHTKKSLWSYPIIWIKSLLPKEGSKLKGNGKAKPSPYIMNDEQDGIANAIRSNIGLSVDKKTGVITISVKDQDPLICKQLADSVSRHLQEFITEYRTNKARIDLEYYQNLTAEAKHEYELARQRYGSYADANTDVILESFRSKRDDLENDMQLKFNNYSLVSTQLQQAKAKVQERTPAFTIIKGASLPIKPAGPKRMIFVFAIMFLTTIITSIVVCRKYLMSFL